jgi:hypothetical protein
MRRALYLFLLATAAGVGCESLPQLSDRPKPPASPSTQATPLPAVSATQVNDANARLMAGALFNELDQEAQGKPAAPAGKPADATQASGKR